MTGTAVPPKGTATRAISGGPGLPGTIRSPGRPVPGGAAWPRRASLRAFTLLEMLVVLAILVVITATGYPALRGSLEKSRLREAAKQIRIELSRARVAAIESGVIWQLRFQEGGAVFELMRAQPADDGQAISFEQEDESATGVTTFGEQSLPDGITFAPLDVSTATEAVPTQDGAPAAQDWSTPIFFYPNGRSSNVRIRLLGSRGLFIDLTLRGITGTAKVGLLQYQAPEATL